MNPVSRAGLRYGRAQIRRRFAGGRGGNAPCLRKAMRKGIRLGRLEGAAGKRRCVTDAEGVPALSSSVRIARSERISPRPSAFMNFVIAPSSNPPMMISEPSSHRRPGAPRP